MKKLQTQLKTLSSSLLRLSKQVERLAKQIDKQQATKKAPAKRKGTIRKATVRKKATVGRGKTVLDVVYAAIKDKGAKRSSKRKKPISKIEKRKPKRGKKIPISKKGGWATGSKDLLFNPDGLKIEEV